MASELFGWLMQASRGPQLQYTTAPQYKTSPPAAVSQKEVGLQTRRQDFEPYRKISGAYPGALFRLLS